MVVLKERVRWFEFRRVFSNCEGSTNPEKGTGPGRNEPWQCCQLRSAAKFAVLPKPSKAHLEKNVKTSLEQLAKLLWTKMKGTKGLRLSLALQQVALMVIVWQASG